MRVAIRGVAISLVSTDSIREQMGMLRAFIGLVLGVALMVFMAMPALAHERPDSFSDLARTLTPSVVNISTSTIVAGRNHDLPQFPQGSPFEDFLEEFRDRSGQHRVQALGSGFIIDESGLVVTNNHVIESADAIRVILHNDKIFEAELLGRDPKTDVAVLKINPQGEKLQPIRFGDSDAVDVGDWVVAIGNPFGLGGTVTAGIVSARGRDIGNGPYDDFIQTDASINRGNSGGPLFDLEGKVIGINTAIFSQTGGSVGIGFAISSNLASNVVGQLVEYGRTRRGWLGVFVQEITPEIAEGLGLGDATGALVSSVHPEGPAAEGGVQAGDIIELFDGKEITDMRSLPRIVAETAIGKKVKVDIRREGEKQTVEIVLGELEQAEEKGLLTSNESPSQQPQNFAKLGFSVAPIDDDTRGFYDLPSEIDGLPLTGVVVIEVAQGSPAAKRGIAEGDIIRRIGQRQINEPSDLFDGIAEAREDNRGSILLLVRRGDRDRFVGLPAE